MPQQKAEALFDFNPTAAVELGLKKGDVIIVRRMDVGEGWWEGELNSLRGLFPCSFVKLLPLENISSQESPKPFRTDSPLIPGGMSALAPGTSAILTPGMSKKAFMETLLAPPTLANDHFYSKEKSSEVFVQGHSDISVTIGPSWDCSPPVYSITVRHQQPESRHSGLKHWSSYLVDTKQLSSSVVRKFKQFLGFYDKMAEIFPCVSLPPLPVKQFSGARDPDGVEARRRGLERFLERVAKHPVLCSTKIFHAFLTAKDEKDWKIGRHSSIMKHPKSAKKFFGAPVYNVVQYPAYNVPLNQLASIEKFSKFSRLLEVNVQTLQSSYIQLSATNNDMLNTLSMLSRDIQRFTKGMQPIVGAQRRKLTASSMAPGIANGNQGVASIHVSLAAPSSQKSLAEEEEGEREEEEEEGSGEWNWRENTRFYEMTQDMHDVAGGMRQLSQQFIEENPQDSLETQVVDVLRDYSGIIHTLPVLVKLHEEAMDMYNASKEKDSKKDAEEIRQQCDTLNNILLAEFDFFSKQMIEDFEKMMESFLCRQANYHRQLAKEWDNIHIRYKKRLSSRKQNKARSSSEDLRLGSDSFTSLSPTSSEDMTLNLGEILAGGTEQDNLNSKLALSRSDSSDGMIPTYINVERRLPDDPGEGGLSDSDIIDPEILKPKKKKNAMEVDLKDNHTPLATTSSSNDARVPAGDATPSFSSDATPSHSGGALELYSPKAKKKKSPLLVTSQAATPSKLLPSPPSDMLVHSESEEIGNEGGMSNPRGNETAPQSVTTTTSVNEHYESELVEDEKTTSPGVVIMAKLGDRCEDVSSRSDTKEDKITPPKTNVTMVNISARYETASPQFFLPVPQESKTQEHEYANLKFAMSNKTLTSQKSVTGESTSPSRSTNKKPMPIQRKRDKSGEVQEGVNVTSSGVSATTSTPKTDNPSAASSVSTSGVSATTSTPKTSHHSTATNLGVSTTTSTPKTNHSSAPKKPVPPVKPPKLGLMDSSVSSKLTPKDAKPPPPPSTPPIDKPRPLSSVLANFSTESSTSDGDERGFNSSLSKPRSYTCVAQRSDLVKKKPILPPPPPVSSMVGKSLSFSANQFPVSPSSSSSIDNQRQESKDTGGSEQVKSPHQATVSSQPNLTKPKVTVQGVRNTKTSLSTLTSELAPGSSNASNLTPFEKGSSGTTTGGTKRLTPPGSIGKGSRPTAPGNTKLPTPSSNVVGRGSAQLKDGKTPKAREELMRKLSLRRLRIEEQIASTDSIPDNSDAISIAPPVTEEEGVWSEHHQSHLSSVSSHSEVVVAYHSKKQKEGGMGTNTPGPSTTQGENTGSYVVDGPSVILRKRGEEGEEGEEGEAGEAGGEGSKDNPLAKYGILEDVDGGSYII